MQETCRFTAFHLLLGMQAPHPPIFTALRCVFHSECPAVPFSMHAAASSDKIRIPPAPFCLTHRPTLCPRSARTASCSSARTFSTETASAARLLARRHRAGGESADDHSQSLILTPQLHQLCRYLPTLAGISLASTSPPRSPPALHARRIDVMA